MLYHLHEYIVGGGEVYEEHLQMFKFILDRIAKYLLLPGLDIDININGKVSCCFCSLLSLKNLRSWLL